MLKNPFVIGTYAGSHYFCDREKETAELMSDLQNGRNIVLISQRRMGKTGLITHVFHQEEIKEQYHTFFVDILATSSLREFVYAMGSTILEQLKPRGRKMLERFLLTLSSLRPAIKLDALTGEPSLEIGLGNIPSVDTTLEEIFAYLNQADKPCIVAFDEFQQVRNYAEQHAEALLRTYIQHCPNARFIFAGSEPSMLVDMFSLSNRPFYQSALSMHLDSIPLAAYILFVRQLFNEHGKDITEGLIQQVYERFEGITLYLQMMMNELFLSTDAGGTADATFLEAALSNLLNKQSFIYQAIFAELTERQREIVRAVAAEGHALNMTSGQFVQKYRLRSASSVQSALKGLINKGIIGKEGEAYVINDRLFRCWVNQLS